MTVSRASLAGVRARVLRQHGEIRARLQGLERAAETTESPLATHHLRVLLLRLASTFDAHLAFEERELTPLIRELESGDLREAAMLEEHVQQRMSVERVTGASDDEPVDGAELRGEVRWLVMSLLDDMDKEEVELASLASIEAERRQMTG